VATTWDGNKGVAGGGIGIIKFPLRDPHWGGALTTSSSEDGLLRKERGGEKPTKDKAPLFQGYPRERSTRRGLRAGELKIS